METKKLILPSELNDIRLEDITLNDVIIVVRKGNIIGTISFGGNKWVVTSNETNRDCRTNNISDAINWYTLPSEFHVLPREF